MLLFYQDLLSRQCLKMISVMPQIDLLSAVAVKTQTAEADEKAVPAVHVGIRSESCTAADTGCLGGRPGFRVPHARVRV